MRTNSGIDGVRLITDDRERLRTTLFFFANGQTKFIVACTTAVKGGDGLDAVFENSMKTFRFETR